jgi:uncharacterized membrane protein YfcA
MDLPKTTSGKWSVRLNTFFVIVTTLSILLVLVFKILSFDDHWWDVTVPILALATIIALFFGIKAVKNKDRSVLVFVSIFISVCAILFVLLHSLFISD